MAKFSMDTLRDNLTKKASSGGGDQSWKLFYPFWKIGDDTQAIVRFLPDLDEDNHLGFLVENLTHELNINGQRKTVGCLSMHGESCPICELSRKYYDEKNETLGKKYYKKRSYVGQVIVMESPIEHDQDQLVKLIEFGPKIFKQIQAAFQSGDLEVPPFEFKGGYNFRIKKTKAGQYADYGTSSFAPKQTDLEDELIDALTLYNLADYRAKTQDYATLEAMLIADQTGSSFADADTPAPTAAIDQFKEPAAQASAPVTPAAAPAATTTAPAEGGGTSSALARLRARAAAQAGNAE